MSNEKRSLSHGGIIKGGQNKPPSNPRPTSPPASQKTTQPKK